MKTNKLKVIAIAAVLGLAIATQAEDSQLPPVATKTGVTYATDIKPIFEASCIKCHDSQKPKQSAKLSLDTLAGALKGSRDGKVIKPGDSAHSDLVLSVAHAGDDPDSYMPKGKKGQTVEPLKPEQIGLIRAWIDQGAK